MDLIKNNIYQTTIKSYSSEGEGIGRINNIAVFVKGAMVDEKVEVKIIKVSKNCAWARLLKIISSSHYRIKPDCKFSQMCGGCSLRHMNYEEELKFKLQKVNDAICRIGKIDFCVKKIHGAQNTDRYRNKAAFPVAYDKNKNIKIGLFQKRSHNVIDVCDCKIQSFEAQEILNLFKKWMMTNHIQAYNEKLQSGNIRHVIVRTNYKNEVLICIVTHKNSNLKIDNLIKLLKNANIQVKGIIQNINKNNTNVILGNEFITLYGCNKIIDKIGDCKFYLSAPSFFQVNRSQAEILYNIALDFADIKDTDTVLDIYCGTGTISLFMAKKAKSVIGIEVVNAAIENAKENAILNDVKNTTFICADAKNTKCILQKLDAKPNIICVDPPRKGLDNQTLNTILDICPQKIVYVSCNPATLARDLSLLQQNNYKIENIEAVDMFPRTPHIETVTKLTLDK